MNTMPDVDIRRGNEPQRFGLTATAIPEANGSQTGVSVENAQSETKQPERLMGVLYTSLIGISLH